MRFDRSRAVRMEFTIDGTSYVLEKEHNRWLVTAPDGYYMPNQQDASDLLNAVAELRAMGAEESEAEAETEYGLAEPRFVFRVGLAPTTDSGEVEMMGPLTVGGVVPGLDQQRFARSAGRSGVFHVRQAFVEAVQAVVAGIHRQAGPSN
jgi:hypothetical protein